jgi:hypothetical protein
MTAVSSAADQVRTAAQATDVREMTARQLVPLAHDEGVSLRDEGATNRRPSLPGSQMGPKLKSLFGWDWRVKSLPGIDLNGKVDSQW